jgi:hypothetical protein
MQRTPWFVFGLCKSTLTVFEICLRACASFPEKLRQFVEKCPTKKGAGAPFSQFLIRRIRCKF